MPSGFKLMERVLDVAPLGVRFHDAVTGSRVSDGLVLEAYSKAAALETSNAVDVVGRRRAFANRSGVQVLMGVRGLRDYETGKIGEDSWDEESPPGARHFVIEVRDLLRRYLPFSFETRLPVRGLFVWDENPLPPESPPEMPDGLPLFSAAARIPAGGMATIRAEIWDASSGAPAAYSLLEARYKGALLGRGMADEKGRIALIVPYPPPARIPLASPLGAPPAPLGAIPPLTQQNWTIDISARYGPVGSPPLSEQGYPDLYTVLNQKTATVWADPARTQPLTTATLKFGRECLVQTEVPSAVASQTERPPRTALLITQAA